MKIAIRTGNKDAKSNRPKMPRGSSKEFASVWRSLLKQLPADILDPIDAIELTLLCNMIVNSNRLSVLVDADPTDATNQRLYLGFVREIHRLSVAFGLNPSDRTRLGTQNKPDESDDPIAKFLGRAKNA